MSSSFATALAVLALTKPESPIAPFIRTAQRAEQEHDEALKKLERATATLTRVVEEVNSK